MVVVTSRLSFAGIFSCIFSPRFVTLKETFPSSSFGALRDDYTAGFIFSSDSGPMMITTSQGKRSKPLICSRVYLFSPRYREENKPK
jgi:hypothetical protein